MMLPVLAITVTTELGIVASRHRARQIAELCGFGLQDQARIATAVSELARGICSQGWEGKVEFFVSSEVFPQLLVIDIAGPGCEPFDTVAGKLMDRFEVTTDDDGTRILLSKSLPSTQEVLTQSAIELAVSNFALLPSNVALSGANQQNRELTDALASLHERQTELVDVSSRLQQTNANVERRNVELGNKADSLITADRRKDEFLSILSHELRGPLSAASMAAQMLEKHPNNPEQTVKLSQLISRQVSHMNRLVEDLVDVSRITRGLVSIAQEPVDMHQVIGAALEQIAPAIRRKNHSITVTLPEAACIVTGDHTRLVQVIGNLLGNAIRYTQDCGEIHVSMFARGSALVVSVRDNGMGISSTLMPTLFDLYVQAEQSSDARNSGLGLGLALVRSLMEAHGGTVQAFSEGEGCGSTFELTFVALAA